MPKRVLIIGLLFILVGMAALWCVVEAAMQGYLRINAIILALPVGVGLLRGQSSSHWWAQIWIILGYVALATWISYSLMIPRTVSVGWSGHTVRGWPAVRWVTGMALGLALPLAVMHHLLYSRRACAWLRRF